jgi:hypothetical protein
MDYEKPIASGKLQYGYDGTPAGVEESWRLTRALDGYSFMRIDLDARSSPEPSSCLYHLLLSPSMAIERIKFHRFGPIPEIQGDVQFGDETISLSRTYLNRKEKSSRRFSEEIVFEPGARFWLPTVVGVGLLAATVPFDSEQSFITLKEKSDFASYQNRARFIWNKKETLVVSRREIAVRPCSISWDQKKIQVWLDDYDWPVKAEILGGHSAFEVAYFRYEIDDVRH